MVVKKAVAKKVVAKAPVKKVVAKAPVKKVAGKAPVKTGAFGRPIVPGAAKKRPVVRAKKKVVLFAAPADFKPHFLLVEVHVEKDGLIGGNVSATRYVGRFDPKAEDKKKFDLGSYDQDTLRAITARLSGITFKTNSERIFSDDPKARPGVKGAHRLPKTAVFHILFRVGKKAADNSLTAGVKMVFQRVTVKSTKTGKMVTRSVLLEKTDPVSRMIRRVGRIMPAAFKNVLMPPKRTRGSRRSEEESDE